LASNLTYFNWQGSYGPLITDINQSGGTDPTCDDITISDISTLISYMFITCAPLPPLLECL